MNIIQVYKKFPTHQDCLNHLEQVRWGEKPKCPYCNSTNSTKTKKRHHCVTCNTSFSVTVGTIFHSTKLDLQKWFLAISIILNAKKGISSRQLARHLDVTKNTAWLIQTRVRRAMSENYDLLKGVVEADETYIGGKEKNKHNNKKTKGTQGRSNKKKTAVIGVIERKGDVKARVVKDVTSKTINDLLRQTVESGATLYTDEWKGYNKISNYQHSRVNHSKGNYVIDSTHTNTIESFWALLKRGIIGQYHKVSVKHLQLYINEFSFRFNNRDNVDIFGCTLARALGV